MRLIDADRLLDLLNDNQAQHDNELKGTYYDGVSNGLEVAIVCVEYAPTVEERKHGHWIVTTIYDENGRYAGRYINCSECGFYWREATHASVFDYCPRCGARMDEEAGK